MIVPGSTSQTLAAELSAALGEPLAAVEYDRFPDGELLTSAPGFDGDRAVVVATTTSPAAHMELLQLQDAVRAAGAEEVLTVLPYMGYAREDAPMSPGAPTEGTQLGYGISARTVARSVSTGADRVLAVNPPGPPLAELFECPAESVDAAARLAAPLPADLEDPLFLAVDPESVGIEVAVRDAYGHGEAVRLPTAGNEGTDGDAPRLPEADPAGRDVVAVDDVVASGATTSSVADALLDGGARRVYVGAVHAVLGGNAVTRLRRAGVERLIATDTVERPVSSVSAAPAVAAALS